MALVTITGQTPKAVEARKSLLEIIQDIDSRGNESPKFADYKSVFEAFASTNEVVRRAIRGNASFQQQLEEAIYEAESRFMLSDFDSKFVQKNAPFKDTLNYIPTNLYKFAEIFGMGTAVLMLLISLYAFYKACGGKESDRRTFLGYGGLGLAASLFAFKTHYDISKGLRSIRQNAINDAIYLDKKVAIAYQK